MRAFRASLVENRVRPSTAAIRRSSLWLSLALSARFRHRMGVNLPFFPRRHSTTEYNKIQPKNKSNSVSLNIASLHTVTFSGLSPRPAGVSERCRRRARRGRRMPSKSTHFASPHCEMRLISARRRCVETHINVLFLFLWAPRHLHVARH